MRIQCSASAYGESRLLGRSPERGGNTLRESHETVRPGILAHTRHDLGGLARNITRLNLVGAAGNVLHAPISLVQDVGDGIAHTVDRTQNDRTGGRTRSRS